MAKRITRKRIKAGLAAVAVLALTAVAVAYWTTSGGGSGTASVGSDSGVTISPVTFAGTLYPGGSTAVSFTINNASADAPVKIGKVVADTAQGTNGVTGLPQGCSASDFSFGDVTVDAEIAKGASRNGSGTLSMANTGANQDACKNASPVLHLKVDETGL